MYSHKRDARARFAPGNKVYVRVRVCVCACTSYVCAQDPVST